MTIGNKQTSSIVYIDLFFNSTISKSWNFKIWLISCRGQFSGEVCSFSTGAVYSDVFVIALTLILLSPQTIYHIIAGLLHLLFLLLLVKWSFISELRDTLVSSAYFQLQEKKSVQPNGWNVSVYSWKSTFSHLVYYKTTSTLIWPPSGIAYLSKRGQEFTTGGMAAQFKYISQRAETRSRCMWYWTTEAVCRFQVNMLTKDKVSFQIKNGQRPILLDFLLLMSVRFQVF